jgi:hypothetical protein
MIPHFVMDGLLFKPLDELVQTSENQTRHPFSMSTVLGIFIVETSGLNPILNTPYNISALQLFHMIHIPVLFLKFYALRNIKAMNP